MSHLQDLQSFDFVALARSKMKDLPENFLIYKFNWLGDMDDRENNIMEVTGAVFREAKSGARKGQVCMMVKGTDRKVYLSPTDIKSIDESRKAQ